MASAAVQNKTPRKVLKKSTRDSLIAYSFIAPNFIGFCVFTLVPMVFAIALVLPTLVYLRGVCEIYLALQAGLDEPA